MDEDNRPVKEFLSKIKNWFTDKRVISRIRVITPKDSFWVSNPKKIKFWKDLAVSQSNVLLGIKDNMDMPSVRISKVVYEGDENKKKMH